MSAIEAVESSIDHVLAARYVFETWKSVSDLITATQKYQQDRDNTSLAKELKGKVEFARSKTSQADDLQKTLIFAKPNFIRAMNEVVATANVYSDRAQNLLFTKPKETEDDSHFN
jgi:hypothetical protein